MIKELYTCGFNITKVDKGQGSVEYGITVMRRYKIFVTRRSKNLIEEMTFYRRNDKGILVGTHHAIDAGRYVCMETCKSRHSISKNQFKGVSNGVTRMGVTW